MRYNEIQWSANLFMAALIGFNAVSSDATVLEKPVGEWLLQHVDVTLEDSSGNGYHGTLEGWIRPAESPIVPATFFNGWNTVGIIPNIMPSLDLTRGLSVSAWVKPEGRDGVILTCSGFRLRVGLAGVSFNVKNVTVTANRPLLMGHWYYVAGTFDGNLIRIFVNGQLAVERAWKGEIDNAGKTLFIGGIKDLENNKVYGGFCFCGAINHVRIYDFALQPEFLTASFTADPRSKLQEPDITRPVLKKMGTIRRGVESTPFVFDDRLYLLIVDRSSPRAKPFRSQFVIMDMETGRLSEPFGEGYTLGCAFVEEGVVYVYGTNRWGGDEIVCFYSRDMQNWTRKKVLDMRGWGIYNMSVCADDSGYVMAFEFHNSPWDVRHRFYTTGFARGTDPLTWAVLPADYMFSKDYYNACPTIRYVDGFYYMIDLRSGLRSYIYRSKNMREWDPSPVNPFLAPSREDFALAPVNLLTEEQRERMQNVTKNSNASDVDLCEFNGRTYVTYSWGDQSASGSTGMWLGYAVYEGGMKEFFKAWFPE